MGKPPLAGRVKTRLGRDIGAARATGFYRLAVARLLTRLGPDPRWQLRLAVNAAPTERYGCWPSRVARMGQGSGSLGDRMAHVLDALPPGPVVIIGTDSPQIEPADIAAAFGALGRHDAVFGPSDDGGYWLVGLARRRPMPGLFADVRWSTEHALEDTIGSLPDGFSHSLLNVLTDVDSGADHHALRSALGPVHFGPWRVAASRSAG
jgi:rSAM/selenodomain-associated transferase 1